MLLQIISDDLAYEIRALFGAHKSGPSIQLSSEPRSRKRFAQTNTVHIDSKTSSSLFSFQYLQSLSHQGQIRKLQQLELRADASSDNFTAQGLFGGRSCQGGPQVVDHPSSDSTTGVHLPGRR